MLYRFGDFTLDAGTRRLLHGGADVHLTPKAFELLHALVAERARALSKAELQERLWPQTFVEETNLASLVAEIRRALGDPAARPRFVRTVYGFGYQFVGDDAPAPGAPRAVGAGPCLVCESRTIPLMHGASVIGRAPDASIRIDAPGVSRHHARLVVSADGATLEDLGSKNGTLVNGRRIASSPLADGDEIRIGATVSIFRVTRPASPTETLPSAG